MKNKELFTLNPAQVNLKNEGVAKIRTINEKEDLSIVEYELKTFVCEGEYHDGLKKILENYLLNYDRPEQPAYWVSGFYGSGKSHLVKMASYLWENFEFPNGKTARGIKPLPEDIRDLFVEIDRKQKLQGKLSIAGTLRDFPSKDIRYSFLQLLLNALGLPQQYHHFKFVHWAKNEGIYDNLKTLIDAAGRDFYREVENIFVSSVLSKAVLELLPELAENEIKLKELFKAQFQRVDNIGREDFVKTIKEEILPFSFNDKIPCTIIVLDEVQQFISQDSNLSFDVQLLAEDLCSRFEGKFLLVGTGQNALRETPNLQRLMARFRIPIQLSNTDIQTVIRKTILEKKPSSVPILCDKMESSLGEISRNLEGTKFGYVTEDKNSLVADYPLLPSTRKFWYRYLQAVDVAGTSGQLRNQLRIVDDCLKITAGLDVGRIVPADFIFGQNTTQLIQSGLLSNETNSIISGKKSLGGDSELESRILSAVFLIDQITSNDRNTKLLSNEKTIADLLIDNLNNNSEPFRNKINSLIKKLVDEKTLMPINSEYKLQTKVGSEWEKEFNKQNIKISNSGEDQIHRVRREKIIEYLKEKTKSISVTQGNSRTNRDFELWDKNNIPNTEYKLNLWVREGWSDNETTVLNEIRTAGNNSPLSYLFVKKSRDTELKSEIIKYLAAVQTINAMGTPTTPEGEQAKNSMKTRQINAEKTIKELVEKICEESNVYLAGGITVQKGTLKENIHEALSSLADRQFPEFKSKADIQNWGQALTKAQGRAPDALKSINYNGDVEKHPISIEILRYIGNNTKSGKEIRNQFMKSPYGWPQDAIDTILIVLKNAEQISSNVSDLRTGTINQANFKKEVHILSASDKIAIRKLFQDAGIVCPPNKEIFPYSNEYIKKITELASKVSGDAPRPEEIKTDFIKEIENKEGNERLLDILIMKNELQSKYELWNKQAETASKREPLWKHLVDLYNFASDSEEMEKISREIEAIRDNRLLFQEPDPIHPLLNEVTEKILNILNGKKQQYNEIYELRIKELSEDEYFKKLTPENQKILLAKHQLLTKQEIKALDSQALLNQLQKTSLYNWDTKIAALPNQFQLVLEDTVKLSAPEAKTYNLPRKTISNQADLDAYITELKKELETLLKKSNSIILK